MRLNLPLVTSFIFNDKEYDIDLSFDNVLDVFEIQSDDSLTDYEKVALSLTLYLDEQDYNDDDTFDLFNHINKEFIVKERKKPVQYDLEGNPMPVSDDDGDEGVQYDFVQDAEAIYSSFQQAYGMNLFKQIGKLHWYEFRALLNGLPSDTAFQQILQIRGWKPSKHDTSEYKEKMKELQRYYALEKG